MQLWRINLKPANAATIDPKDYCIGNNIVGIGWPIDFSGDLHLSWETYYHLAWLKYKEGENKSKGWIAAANAIGTNIQIGDLVWTRNKGVYYLGKITGDWYYDKSAIAKEADIVNVRPCIWEEVGTEQDVPGKIGTSFMGMTLCRIKDPFLNTYSRLIYTHSDEESVDEIVSFNFDDPLAIFSFLSPDDCENILALYLQKEFGYFILPSSSKITTERYEFVLLDSASGEVAFVQVKNGKENLFANNYSHLHGKVYLWSVLGNVSKQESQNVEVIDSLKMVKFMNENVKLMTPFVKKWMRFLSNHN